MFNQIEIFTSTNEKQIIDLQNYLRNCYLKEQGVKTKIECLSVEGRQPLYFISAKRKNYNAVVGAASSYFVNHLTDDTINDIYVNNNAVNKKDMRAICATKIPFGRKPEDIFERI